MGSLCPPTSVIQANERNKAGSVSADTQVFSNIQSVMSQWHCGFLFISKLKKKKKTCWMYCLYPTDSGDSVNLQWNLNVFVTVLIVCQKWNCRKNWIFCCTCHDHASLTKCINLMMRFQKPQLAYCNYYYLMHGGEKKSLSNCYVICAVVTESAL